jgi:hypothetical protein
MKVLTIKQPYADYIKNGSKTIETRSFKTNYRGELYIHSSAKPEVGFDTNDFACGYIICKCELVDCILMDENFIKNLDKEELKRGFYEIGRYAWILRNIEPLKSPIKCKGKLGIWEFK